MKVKIVEIAQASKVKITFPCILKSKDSGLIVFFWQDSCGIVLNTNKHYELNHISVGWNSVNSLDSYWQYYKGEIILSNDEEIKPKAIMTKKESKIQQAIIDRGGLALKNVISCHILDDMPNTEPHLKPQLANSLTNLVLDIINKFDKGQKEHSESIHDIDFEHEIYCELMDAFIYNSAKKWTRQ